MPVLKQLNYLLLQQAYDGVFFSYYTFSPHRVVTDSLITRIPGEDQLISAVPSLLIATAPPQSLGNSSCVRNKTEVWRLSALTAWVLGQQDSAHIVALPALQIKSCSPEWMAQPVGLWFQLKVKRNFLPATGKVMKICFHNVLFHSDEQSINLLLQSFP